MQSVRLGKGVYITAEYADGQYTLRNASGGVIGVVAKDDTFKEPQRWYTCIKQEGEWGEWAIGARALLQHRRLSPSKTKKATEWEKWAANRASSLKLRARYRCDSVKNRPRPIDKSQWEYGQQWASSCRNRLVTKSRRTRRCQWTVWAETKHANWKRKIQGQRWTESTRPKR